MADAPDRAPITPWWKPVLFFMGIAALLFLVAGLSLAHLPYIGSHTRADRFPGRPWLDAWVRWDAAWYGDIAERGYWAHEPGKQSPVAFFPAYPMLMRAGGWVVGSSLLAGILITVAAGAASAALFAIWLRDRVSEAAARTALALFLLFPFAFFLYGAVYADALFVAAALGAFVLLERDRPWLAGLVGALATAARPVGALLVLALAIRAVERRGGIRQARWRDAGVLVAGCGIGAFCVYTWVRFGTPFAFVEAQEGWGQEAGPKTWFKIGFFKDLFGFSRSPFDLLDYVAHPVFTLAALVLVPLVVRRLGWGYGVYVVVVVGLSAVSTRNFFGMARYVLVAFPCFAVAGELLADRARLRVAALSASVVGLLGATSFFARGYYLS
ncbi:MAG: hypothetical protein LC799_23410 [Actinobacteria bacterium]|nr:hypothetical protein [Actinomycetota bacterium]